MMLPKKFFCVAFAVLLFCSCKKNSGGGGDNKTAEQEVMPATDVAFWLTQADQFALFKQQKVALNFSSATNSNPTIAVDSSLIFQTMDGFGYTLTGGSASHINGLPEATKSALLKELFLTDSSKIGISYLRISIGASDLSAQPFTYNDLDAGQTDPYLSRFSIDKERTELIPVLKKILALAPDIKILGSPWTAPTWMKTNNGFVGGSLKPEYYGTYANYFVKYIEAMKAEGITIDAITVQNEPMHGGNNPSMLMSAQEQANFIKNHLGPAFAAKQIATKIIIFDHNAGNPEYPLTVLYDSEARKYIDGSAFHLYGGDISALSQVRNAFPDKKIYFTEQWVGGPGNFAGDLRWHVKNLIVGASRNWSRNVLEWNLAADAEYKPHTAGGCTNCLGAITVSSGKVTRNVAYYIIAHASKFVRPGSKRIESNITANLQNVAFKTPTGKVVLIVLNDNDNEQSFNIRFNGKQVSTSLKGGAVGTFVW